MGFYLEGDRVEMSHLAIKAGLNCGNKKYKPTTGGTVMEDQQGNLIIIRRDGRLGKSSYHAKFWILSVNRG